MKRLKGYSLIELMMAVAIVGILVAVVYPSYTENLARSHRSEAMSELVRIANLQEQYFADNRTYTTNVKELGLATNPYITTNGYYSIAAAASGNITSGYIITATAYGNQASQDSYCTSFSINHLGQKTAKKGSVDNSTMCWEK